MAENIDDVLKLMKGLKFIETLKVTFTKMVDGELLPKSAYFQSKPHTITNNLDITESLQVSKQHILNMISSWLSEGSGWTVESVDNHYLNIVKYKPMKGSSLKNKGLINMKNSDNECFRWCHIRHINPQLKDPQRI